MSVGAPKIDVIVSEVVEVNDLIKRFRYLNQTVAVVLGVVAVKLLIQDVYKAPAFLSLAIVIGLFAAGKGKAAEATWKPVAIVTGDAWRKAQARMAEMLGKLHEYKTSPLRAAGYALGLNEMPPDYAMDTHNNALGAEMSAIAQDPDKLREAVREAIRRGTKTPEKGRAYLMPEPDPATQGYAAGGLVDYDPNEIDTIVSRLIEEFHG